MGGREGREAFSGRGESGFSCFHPVLLFPFLEGGKVNGVVIFVEGVMVLGGM